MNIFAAYQKQVEQIFDFSNTYLNWVLGVYGTAFLIQLFYFWGLFGRFAFYRGKTNTGSLLPVSVVISAKNEYTNLKKNLPLILNQDYPDFEVVVVNDVSDDETIFLLEDLSREYKHLKVVSITQDLNFFKGKKFPLSLGIKSAKNEQLLLTDADCTPSGTGWIRSMCNHFDDKTEVILGYGKYKMNDTLLNKIIRYETLFTAIQYFSFALIGFPYMGVGRNLAYKKSLFIKNKGFISHYKLSSGDDDLFINEVANKKNTHIEVSSESFTISPAKKTFTEWWIQKRRHLSTGKYYKRKHKLLLGAYSFTLFILFLLFILLISYNYAIYIVLALFFIRLISQFVILKKSMSRLEEKKLLLLSPLIEVFLMVVYPVIVIVNLVSKQSKWK